jgi:hypothetical protein
MLDMPLDVILEVGRRNMTYDIRLWLVAHNLCSIVPTDLWTSSSQGHHESFQNFKRIAQFLYEQKHTSVMEVSAPQFARPSTMSTRLD